MVWNRWLEQNIILPYVTYSVYKLVVYYHIPSPPVQRIHLCGNTAFSTSTIQSPSSMIAIFLVTLSGVVHTGVEVCGMYSEMSGLVE